MNLFRQLLIVLLFGVFAAFPFNGGHAQEASERYGVKVSLTLDTPVIEEDIQGFIDAVPGLWIVNANIARYELEIFATDNFVKECKYSYSGLYVLSIYRVDVRMVLTDLETDELIGSESWTGSTPVCGESEEFTTYYKTKRGYPSAATADDWLAEISTDLPALSPPVVELVGELGSEISQIPVDGAVLSAMYHPRGDQILTTTARRAEIWNVPSGERVRPLFYQSALVEAIFSPDGDSILALTKEGAIMEGSVVGSQANTVLYVFDTYDAAFDPSGRAFAIVREYDSIEFFRCPTCDNQDYEVNGMAGVRRVAFQPGGQHIAYAARNIRIVDRSFKEILTIEVHTRLVNSLEFSPDGLHLLSASIDGNAIILDVETGEPVFVLAHPDAVSDASYRADGRYIVTACWDGIARIWDATTGEEMLQLVGHEGAINTARFSPDGRTIVTAGQDETARIWNVESLGN